METQTALRLLPCPCQLFDIPHKISYEQYQAWRNEDQQQENAVEVKREDGTTLVYCDDPTNGRYIALFDQTGKNLQHISLDDQELVQLKSWVNGLDLPDDGHDLEPDCEGHDDYEDYEGDMGALVWESQFDVMANEF